MQKLTVVLFSVLFSLAACASNETSAPNGDPDVPSEQIRSGSQIEQSDEVALEVIGTPVVEEVVDTPPAADPSRNETASAYPAPETNDTDSAYPVGTDDDNFLPVVLTAGDPVLISSLRLQEIANGYVKPVHITHAGDERLFVVEQNGYITILQDGQMAQPPFLDIDARVGSSASEQGLLSVAFHPDFATNDRFFVYYTDNSGDVIVSEFGMSADPAIADVDSERIIIKVPQPFGNHNGGQLQFGPDGYLYIGLGDGGSGGDPECNGLDRETLLGSILRIDVDGEQPYAIPDSNPFATHEQFRPEIWSWGWRNPWRFSFDLLEGDMYIADVGQNSWEEVNWESAESPGGLNYGWNAFEGKHIFDPDEKCGDTPTDAVLPITEYGREEGRSITGGYIYRGTQIPELWGNYLYADFATGNIWATVQPASGAWETLIVLESGLNISSFGEGVDGELYLLHHGGKIYQVVGAEAGE